MYWYCMERQDLLLLPATNVLAQLHSSEEGLRQSEAEWIAKFAQQRFRFRTPPMVEAALHEAQNVPESSKARAILRAVADGLSGNAVPNANGKDATATGDSYQNLSLYHLVQPPAFYPYIMEYI
jgi:hypothetical protein